MQFINQRIEVTASVFLFKDENLWIAHCLEYDIAGQGDSSEAARESFQKIFMGQIILDLNHNKAPLQGCDKAPKSIWDKFNKAKEAKIPQRRPIYLPEDRINATLNEYAMAV